MATASQQVICKTTDSIYLGNLNNSNYLITLHIAIVAGSNVTCSNPWNKDTFQLIYTTVGMNEVGETSFTLSPNPSTAKLNLQLTNLTSAKLNFQILAADGRVLLQNKVTAQPNFGIDVTHLPSGLYFLQLQDDKQRTVRKFVKQ